MILHLLTVSFLVVLVDFAMAKLNVPNRKSIVMIGIIIVFILHSPYFKIALSQSKSSSGAELARKIMCLTLAAFPLE